MEGLGAKSSVRRVLLGATECYWALLGRLPGPGCLKQFRVGVLAPCWSVRLTSVAGFRRRSPPAPGRVRSHRAVPLTMELGDGEGELPSLVDPVPSRGL